MKILYGTGNQAKFDVMKQHLEGIGIELIGLKDLDYLWPEVEESGNDPLENARIKAKAYYECCHIPVFSCDSGLYIEGLPQQRQPGVHVRNVNGKRLTDSGMVEYYAGLARDMGGSCIARYKNAICFVLNDKEIHEHMGHDISGEAFQIVTVPHEKIEEGFPIDRLSVHIPTGKYYNDLDELQMGDEMRQGFQHFFRKCLNAK